MAHHWPNLDFGWPTSRTFDAQVSETSTTAASDTCHESSAAGASHLVTKSAANGDLPENQKLEKSSESVPCEYRDASTEDLPVETDAAHQNQATENYPVQCGLAKQNPVLPVDNSPESQARKRTHCAPAPPPTTVTDARDRDSDAAFSERVVTDSENDSEVSFLSDDYESYFGISDSDKEKVEPEPEKKRKRRKKKSVHRDPDSGGQFIRFITGEKLAELRSASEEEPEAVGPGPGLLLQVSGAEIGRGLAVETCSNAVCP